MKFDYLVDGQHMSIKALEGVRGIKKPLENQKKENSREIAKSSCNLWDQTGLDLNSHFGTYHRLETVVSLLPEQVSGFEPYCVGVLNGKMHGKFLACV